MKEIDLKLPSGTLWGDRNLGAPSPLKEGKYVSWGGLDDKESYFLKDYEYWQYIRIGEHLETEVYYETVLLLALDKETGEPLYKTKLVDKLVEEEETYIEEEEIPQELESESLLIDALSEEIALNIIEESEILDSLLEFLDSLEVSVLDETLEEAPQLTLPVVKTRTVIKTITVEEPTDEPIMEEVQIQRERVITVEDYEYKLVKYSKEDGETRLMKSDDCAYNILSGSWSTPTVELWEELFEVCDISVLDGCIKAEHGGNYILLPISGYKHENNFYSFLGSYWSNTRLPENEWYANRAVLNIIRNKPNVFIDKEFRILGLQVRPVRKR